MLSKSVCKNVHEVVDRFARERRVTDNLSREPCDNNSTGIGLPVQLVGKTCLFLKNASFYFTKLMCDFECDL